MVVFPRTTEEVSAIVKIAAEYGVPHRRARRGHRTERRGDSARGRRHHRLRAHEPILEIDLENERAWWCSRAW
jgi:FAD/FMN-containing dehydrogenase